MIKILSLQRESHVAPGVPSLSVSARITEALEFLRYKQYIDFISISESDEVSKDAIKWADVVILNKHNSYKSLDLVRYANEINKKIIYDIDDWIFKYPRYSGGFSEANFEEKQFIISEILSLSDVVTVANEELKKRLSGSIKNLELVPNGMWVEKYVPNLIPPDSCDNENIRVAFTNADFIKLNSAKGDIMSSLQLFFLANPTVSMDFYGDMFPEMYSLPFISYTSRLAYDVYLPALINGRYCFSIVPLGGKEDHDSYEFNACKNPFKYLNYGVSGIPGIYSDAAIYEGCITNGINGLLVENNFESWSNSMIELLNNKELRDFIRINAFYDVYEKHHIKKSAMKFYELL